MPDNGQIDNLYIELEAKGNAQKEIDKLDKTLERLDNTIAKTEKGLSKLDTQIEKFGGNKFNIDIGANKLDKDAAKVDRAAKKIERSLEKIKISQKSGEPQKQSFISDADLNAETFKNKGSFDWEAILALLGPKGKIAAGILSITKSLKPIGKALTKPFTEFFKKVTGGFKFLTRTIRQFAVFGTFFTIQRIVSESAKQGTENLYQFSKLINGDFAQSMDRLSTSFLFLKNALAATFSPIINYFTPTIERVVDGIANFSNKIAEALAALTGAKTFNKAIKSFKEYQEAITKTNNALAKFDEINNITTKKGDELDYGSLFVVENVGVKGWIANIIKDIRNGDWENVGFEMSMQLNKSITNIDTKKLGNNLAQKMNNVFNFGAEFLTMFDTKQLSSKITNFIDTFLQGTDWYIIGVTFNALILDALDFLDSFTEWLFEPKTKKEFIAAITDFFDAIKWQDISSKITTLILRILKGLQEWIISPTTLKTLGKIGVDIAKGIGNGIVSHFKTLKWDEILFSSLTFLNPALFGTISVGKQLLGYASGGYPTSGQVFVARENGLPEMVGSIGGRTAVANNDQIVEAVSIGVYNAVVDAMSRTSNNQHQSIIIGGREVFRVVQEESAAYRSRTGQPAF